jgi:N4-gp56 family major capsid protein
MANGFNSTSTLTNSIRVQYVEKYLMAAKFNRLYDFYAGQNVLDKPMSEIFRGSSVTLPYLNDLEPSTDTISEVYDAVPVQLTDGTVSITPTSRIRVINDSEKLLMTTYTKYAASRFEKMGLNLAESVDLHAQTVGLTGGGLYRATTRAGLDSGTAGHLCTSVVFDDITADFMTLHAPGWETTKGPRWLATMSAYVWNDIRTSNNVLAVGQYQNQNIITRNEFGELGSFRLQVSPWAKAFWGAGADNASAVATTLSAAAAAGATSITVASASNITVGAWINLGTEETANTHYYNRQHVQVTSVVSTTIGIRGQGPSGGLRFALDSGSAVDNNDSVGTVLFGGPESLVKIFATEMGNGQYGTLVGPKVMGSAEQFVKMAWKWYGAYGIPSESWLTRGEFALGRDS